MICEYRVLIDGDDMISWTGFIRSDRYEDVVKIATELAERMGGDFLNVLEIELV